MAVAPTSGRELRKTPLSNRLRTDTLQILIFLFVVTGSVGSAVYAASLSWTSSNRITVTTSSLSVFLDSALTQTAPNSVDFGTLQTGQHTTVNYWIRNDSGNIVSLSWTSDLNSNSVTGYVSDSWSWNDGQTWRNLNGYSLEPGAVIRTQYIVTISTITPTGTYTWSVTLSGS